MKLSLVVLMMLACVCTATFEGSVSMKASARGPFEHQEVIDQSDAKLFLDIVGADFIKEHESLLETSAAQKVEEDSKPITVAQCFAKCKETFPKTDEDDYKRCSKKCIKMSGPFRVRECYKLCKAMNKADTKPCETFKVKRTLAAAWLNYFKKKKSEDPKMENEKTKNAETKYKKYAGQYVEAKKAAQKHTGFQRLVKPPPPEKCDKEMKNGVMTNIDKCLKLLRRTKDTVGNGGIRVTKAMKEAAAAKLKAAIAKALARKKKDEEEAAKAKAAEAKRAKELAALKAKADWAAKRKKYHEFLKARKQSLSFSRLFRNPILPRRSRLFWKSVTGLEREVWTEYSYCFWIRPLTARHGHRFWASIMHIGRTNHNRFPGLWLYPGSTRLHIRSGTNRQWNAGCDAADHLQAWKWTHVCYSHSNSGEIKVYYNGAVKASCKVGHPPARHGNRLWMNSRGFLLRFGWFRRKRRFYVMPLYLSDPWHYPAPVHIARQKMFGAVLSQAHVTDLHKNCRHP